MFSFLVTSLVLVSTCKSNDSVRVKKTKSESKHLPMSNTGFSFDLDVTHDTRLTEFWSDL